MVREPPGKVLGASVRAARKEGQEMLEIVNSLPGWGVCRSARAGGLEGLELPYRYPTE